MYAGIAKYLHKRADLDTRPLVSGPLDGIEQVVVIPALAESASLFGTLESLAANDPAELRRTLVIVVVNNRALPHADAADIEDNQRTLERLGACGHRSGPGTLAALRLAYVDASSPGCELPEKDGVGLARKIGLDWGLAVLQQSDAASVQSVRRGRPDSGRTDKPCRLLFSLDADALVAPDYLAAVRTHFERYGALSGRPRSGAWAGVVAYAHRLDGAPDEVAGIVCYELFLRYHALGLAYAGSPYALHAIGSTIVCRAEAYVAVSGMNRRLAGEDFYFLQQLIKTGCVHSITTTTVYPSCRASARVPFGTGPRIRAFGEGRVSTRPNQDQACVRGRPDKRLRPRVPGTPDPYAVHHPESYRILKEWLGIVANNLDGTAGDLLSEAQRVCPALHAFLESACLERTWDNLDQHSAHTKGLHDQFHRWFDGLKTLRLIHHLRDNGFPQQDMFEAIHRLLGMAGIPPPMDCSGDLRNDLERQMALLEHLRACAP